MMTMNRSDLSARSAAQVLVRLSNLGGRRQDLATHQAVNVVLTSHRAAPLGSSNDSGEGRMLSLVHSGGHHPRGSLCLGWNCGS